MLNDIGHHYTVEGERRQRQVVYRSDAGVAHSVVVFQEFPLCQPDCNGIAVYAYNVPKTTPMQ